jgi:hypothetical protein
MTRTTDASGAAGSGLLAGPVLRRGPGWSTTLALPLGHPFFFDHPLDHVSGALTICSLLDLADAVAGPAARGDRLLLDLRFPAMGTLTDPTELGITPDQRVPGRWSVTSRQEDVEICGGTLQRVGGLARPGGPALPAREALCPKELVHRAAEENIVLGAPVDDGTAITAPVAPPDPGHYLDPDGTGACTARALIESSRQFFTLLEHEAAGWAFGAKVFLMTFQADIPAVPPGPSYSFRWSRQPVKGSKLAVSFDLLDAAGELAGRFEYLAITVSPAAYERFRASRVRLAGGAAA